MSMTADEHAVTAGAAEVAAAVDTLAARLPHELAPLAAVAYNYLWSWLPGGRDVFEGVDENRFALCGRNPVRLLYETPVARLQKLAADPEFLARMRAIADAMAAELDRPAGDAPWGTAPAAFFCAEYAVHQSLPVYSGGLGVLAGDILKAASDLALPLIAVGLMYRQGYFRQRIDAGGYQHEYWVDSEPALLPAALVCGPDGQPRTVTVALAGHDAVCQIWRVSVGRVPLLLLDTNRPENTPTARFITSRLYVGDPDIRLEQYAVLGIGGMRALRDLGVDPAVIHLNEGHAAFAALELAGQIRDATAVSAEQAFADARSRVVFTTHTPVAAGNDTYPAGQVETVLADAAARLAVSPSVLIAQGRTHPQDAAEPFGVTQFALRLSRTANGVAARHGEVARDTWKDLWPGRTVDEVPITAVTNGVHTATWLGGPLHAVLDRHLPTGWLDRCEDPAAWEAVAHIPGEEIWTARSRQRAALVTLAADRSVMERLGRGEARDYVHAAADTLSPDVLTIGFARRLTSYKRLHLLLREPERMAALLSNAHRPVQVLIAGKAHPKDEDGKQLVAQLFTLRHLSNVAGRVVFLDDYDLNLAAALVRGCDVWLNLPRPPLEASGTSGMKSALNGGLQLSVLDGWWPEVYDTTNGWAISGEVTADEDDQDARHAAELYRLLSEDVIPTFYDRDPAGLPQQWLGMIRRSIATCGPMFSARRMVSDYAHHIYPDA
jgi:starch phosphorylase